MYVFSNFGPYVERRFEEIIPKIGSIVFIIFYCLMIVAGNMPSYKKHYNNYGYRAIGASGAVAAILFSYIVFKPTSSLLLYLSIPIPAVLFGILYLWYESWAGKKQMDNIGHDAHFFGAIAGFLFTIALKPSLIVDFFNQIIEVF
jgi:membrane associated rhomboid family serine protease